VNVLMRRNITLPVTSNQPHNKANNGMSCERESITSSQEENNPNTEQQQPH